MTPPTPPRSESATCPCPMCEASPVAWERKGERLPRFDAYTNRNGWIGNGLVWTCARCGYCWTTPTAAAEEGRDG